MRLYVVFTDKPLLMLQSIKRAFRIDPKNVELHSCFVRFAMKLVTLKKQTEPATESPVLTVIEQEMEPILRGRSADQINKEFLAENSNSLPALFEGKVDVREMGGGAPVCLFGAFMQLTSY